MVISEIGFPEEAVVPGLWFVLVLILSLVYQLSVAASFSAQSRLFSRIALIALLIYTGKPLVSIANYAYGRYLLETEQYQNMHGNVAQVIEQGGESILYLRQPQALLDLHTRSNFWQQGRCLSRFRLLHAHLNKPVEIRYTKLAAQAANDGAASEQKAYYCILSIASKS